MVVKNNDVIKVEYEIFYEDGTLFDSSDNHGGPVKLHMGSGQILRALENTIIGMEVGEEKISIIQPSDAYGEFNPLLVEKIDISSFPEDISLEIGKQIDIVGANGMSSPGWIRLIEDSFVIVDMNHPCAGHTLKFRVKIIQTGLEPDPIQNPFVFGGNCNCGCDHH